MDLSVSRVLITSLSLKKALSSIGADCGSGLTKPLVCCPSLPWMLPPPQSQKCYPPLTCYQPGCYPHQSVKIPLDLLSPYRCYPPPLWLVTPRVHGSAKYLAFVVKSLVVLMFNTGHFCCAFGLARWSADFAEDRFQFLGICGTNSHKFVNTPRELAIWTLPCLCEGKSADFLRFCR